MAAVAMRKKVVSIGHFSPSSVSEILLDQKQLYVLTALKIREK